MGDLLQGLDITHLQPQTHSSINLKESNVSSIVKQKNGDGKSGVIKWDPFAGGIFHFMQRLWGNFEGFPENNSVLFGLVI